MTTTPRPVERIERLFFFLNAGLCSLGILISLAIGFRQPDRKSSRALALAFLWFSTNLGADYAPPQWPLVYARVMNDAAFVPGWYFLLWFAIHYPDGIPTGWRRGLRRVLPLFLIGAVVGTAMHVASALGRIAPDAAGTAYLVYVGAAGPLTLVAFWDGWRRSSGVSRQRFTWLLGGFALFFVVSYSTWVNWLVIDASEHYVKLVSVLGSLAMYVGLSYAILRHRVLDMGLALNRSLVFAVVGAVLLGTFQLLQVVTARLLHFDDPAKAGLAQRRVGRAGDAGLPEGQASGRMADRPPVLPRLGRARGRSRQLRRRCAAASPRRRRWPRPWSAPSTGSPPGPAQRCTCARAMAASNASRARRQAPQTAAPQSLDADEPLAVALRAGRSVARCDEVHSTLPGELAMVLSRQRELDAFVLIGRRRDGSVLRSDEVAALRASAAIGRRRMAGLALGGAAA